jgi:mono/diheme cytochrome c family protein
MTRASAWVICVAAIAPALAGAPAWGGQAEKPAAKDLVAKGKYVFATAGGCACHTPPGAPGLNAGGQKFAGPFGVVYSRNITPDRATGIGAWTSAQVVNAIRRGERPDGTHLFPVHPYEYMAHMADDEVSALAAYLKSVKAVGHKVPPRELKGPPPAIPVPEAPKVAPTAGLARGEYLVKGPTHCGDCHTPRRPDGSQDLSLFLAGGPGPEGTTPSNITPHPITGIGRWTEEQIATLLRTGERPNAGPVGSLMHVVIQGSSVGYKDMTRADALAIAQYLKTVPAIDHKVR